MVYTHENNAYRSAPRNVPIWAVAYDVNDDYDRNRLICKPTCGMILDVNPNNGHRIATFFPFKKDGKELQKNGVGVTSRIYADSYDEAVKLWNDLVLKRVAKLQGYIQECYRDIIKT